MTLTDLTHKETYFIGNPGGNRIKVYYRAIEKYSSKRRLFGVSIQLESSEETVDVEMFSTSLAGMVEFKEPIGPISFQFKSRDRNSPECTLTPSGFYHDVLCGFRPKLPKKVARLIF